MTSHRTARHRISASGVVALIAFTGCGSSRPTTADWKSAWDRDAQVVRSVIDNSVADRPTINSEGCKELLTVAARARNDIERTPKANLDDKVAEWIAFVEATGTDCNDSTNIDETLVALLGLTDTIDKVILADEPTR